MREQAIHHFTAESGLLIWVRPLKASDGPLLIDLFEHLGPDSRYQRFNIPLSNPDPDWVQRQAEKLAYIRPAEGRGWLAFADLPDQPNAPVAGIRYVIVEPKTAELSLVVRDDLQTLGIGTELLRFAGRKAYAGGVDRLTGVVQSANYGLWRSVRNLEVPVKRKREGSYTVIEVDLREAEVFHWKLPDDSDEEGD